MNKNKISFVLIAIFLYVTANSQITKGYWLVGGNINYSSTTNSSSALANAKYQDLKLNPNVGYFFLDKLSVGLRCRYSYNKYEFPDRESDIHDFNAGPFVRYYYLLKPTTINIFSEGFYEYGFTGQSVSKNFSKNIFGLASGIEIYFNTSIAIEMSLGYDSETYTSHSGSNNAIRFGIGLQAHLIKEKK